MHESGTALKIFVWTRTYFFVENSVVGRGITWQAFEKLGKIMESTKTIYEKDKNCEKVWYFMAK